MFKKAERKQIKLKIGITGPSGSGKTMSALRLTRGLVGPKGKIAFGDTENGSASLYSDKFDFDVVEIKPPYTVDKFISVVDSALKAGYDALVLDSISHQWKGEGGILNKKEQMDARGGNSFTNWGKLTPEQEKFLASILHSNIHIISTLRSKQEYIVEQNDKGKQAPRKVGLAPIQREGMEYEFTTVFDVAMNHEAETSKDRTGLFTDKVFQITEKTGEELAAWISSGKFVEAAPDPKPATQQTKGTPYTGNPAEYVVKVGKKYVGQAFKDMQPTEIDGFAQWIVDDAKKKDKAISPEFQEFVDVADKYLESINFFPPKDPPELNTNETIN